MKKVIVLFITSIFILPIYGQFKAKMVFNSMGKERAFTVYSSDDGYRYEFNEDGQEGAIIVTKGSSQVIILMPAEKMAMKSPAGSSMNTGNDPIKSYEQYKSDGILKEVGKETINGIECTKSILYDKDNPTQKLFTIWFSEKYNFPIKMINHVDGEDGSGMELKDIEPWKPNSNSFSIPEGYQLMDMGGMMRER
ncbi:MAG: DUF4412 domain-containing protein [Bacteroidales bacterium]|nr:DUF4412 domain-containing protein [Bacteroidales bacterium]